MSANRRGQIVTRRQVWCFVTTIALFWFASDWPMHDIGETYLYSVHMMQHMILSYFLPPLALLAMPEWLLRLIVGEGRGYRVLRAMTKPVVAGVLFNLVVMTTHIPGVVNASGTNAVLHYSLHFLLVTTSLLMWMPVIGPFKELHMGNAGKMVYLFMQSVIPTLPGAWGVDPLVLACAAELGLTELYPFGGAQALGPSPTSSSTISQEPWRLGSRTGGPPFSVQVRRSRCEPSSIVQETSTQPVGVESAPNFVVLVQSSLNVIASAITAPDVILISGPLK